LDIRLSNKFLTPFQAEYLLHAFGNSCANVVGSNNNNQNSFGWKSGIVVAVGVATAAASDNLIVGYTLRRSWEHTNASSGSTVTAAAEIKVHL